MDHFDETQALDVTTAYTDEETTRDDQKPVGTLKVLSQKGLPETLYPIRRGENVLGRSIDLCQIHIPRKVLSKRHAVFEVDADTHCVYDAGSHNKSFKGKLYLKPNIRYELRDGETLKFADVLCRYYKTYTLPANIDDDDTGSVTEMESIVTELSTASKHPQLPSSKQVEGVSNEVELEISNKLDSTLKEFELKSDSDVDDDSEGDKVTFAEKILAPETPFIPRKARDQLSRASSSRPRSPSVFSETGSDTDIEEDCAKRGAPLQTSETTVSVRKPANPPTESEIDWENMQTQAFVMPESSDLYCMPNDNRGISEGVVDNIMSAETQVITNSGCWPSEQVNVTPAVISKTQVKGHPVKVSEHFVTQSSDEEMRSVQEAVATVLQSKAFSSDSLTTGVRDLDKDAPVTSNDSDDTIVVGIQTPNSDTAVSASNVVGSPDANPSAVVDDLEPSTPKNYCRKGVSKKSVNDFQVNRNEVQEAQAKDGNQPVSKKQLKDLPDPVALNQSLPSSRKTYSRRQSLDRSSVEEWEQKSNGNDALVGTNPVLKPKSAKKSAAECSPLISHRKKKVDEKNEETSLHQPTAPSLRIFLGVSPTCELLCPMKKNDTEVKIPSTEKTLFKRVTTSKSASVSASASTPIQLDEGEDARSTIEVVVGKSRNKKKTKSSEGANLRVEHRSPTPPPIRRSLRSAKSASVTSTEPDKVPWKERGSKSRTPSKRKLSATVESEDSDIFQESEIGETMAMTPPTRRRRIKNGTDLDSSKGGKDELNSVDQLPRPSPKYTRKARGSAAKTPSPAGKISKGKQNSNAESVNRRTRRAKSESTMEALDDEGQVEEVTSKGRCGRAAAAQKRTLHNKDETKGDVEPIEKKPRKRRGNAKASPKGKKSVGAKDDKHSMSSTEAAPKVMFTGMCDPKLEKTITALGGELVDSVFECTHLVTDKIRRTVKLLCTLARGQPIVEAKWISNCEKAKSFVDCSPFIILDKSAERQHGFVLAESLQKAKEKGLLEEFSIHVTPSVMPVPEEMKLIIECARGKFLRVMPKKLKDGNRSTLIISCEKDVPLCSSAILGKIPMVTSEFILTGVLRQEVLIDTMNLHAVNRL